MTECDIHVMVTPSFFFLSFSGGGEEDHNADTIRVHTITTIDTLPLPVKTSVLAMTPAPVCFNYMSL